MMAASKFKLALIQLKVSATKSLNLSRAAELVCEASAAGAQLVALPECFNCPYGVKYFPEYAEPIPGESSEHLSRLAKDNHVYLVGGTIPEKGEEGKLFNTCLVFDPNGECVAKHRKVHLFDIDVPGKIRFKESDALVAGSSLTSFDTPFCKVGLGICYDLRFAPMAQIYSQEECKLILYPGQFNMTTGPAHWQLLNRARALDNQLYVASCAAARDEMADYVSWAHSICCSPWGDVTQAEDKEAILYADIDLGKVKEVRESIPLTRQKRDDLYEVKRK